jgi:hypothetical protein
MATATEWWYDDSGTNTLKGVEDDPDNPIILDDTYIVQFICTVPAALESFNRIVPNMLPEEQLRLNALAAGIPKYEYSDPRTDTDEFQNRWNRSGIHTTGPNGGGCPFPR